MIQTIDIHVLKRMNSTVYGVGSFCFMLFGLITGSQGFVLTACPDKTNVEQLDAGILDLTLPFGVSRIFTAH